MNADAGMLLASEVSVAVWASRHGLNNEAELDTPRALAFVRLLSRLERAHAVHTTVSLEDGDATLLLEGMQAGQGDVQRLNALRELSARDEEYDGLRDPARQAEYEALRDRGTPTLRTFLLKRIELGMITARLR